MLGRATNPGAHEVDEGTGHPSLRRPHSRGAQCYPALTPGLCFPPPLRQRTFRSTVSDASKEIIDAAAATPAPCGVLRRSCVSFRPVPSGLRSAARNTRKAALPQKCDSRRHFRADWFPRRGFIKGAVRKISSYAGQEFI